MTMQIVGNVYENVPNTFSNQIIKRKNKMKKENIIVELYKTDDEGGFEFTQYYENEQPIGIVDGDVLVQRYRFLAKDWTWNEDEQLWWMPSLGDVYQSSLEEVVYEDLEGMLDSLKTPTLDSVLEYMDDMVEAEYYEKVVGS